MCRILGMDPIETLIKILGGVPKTAEAFDVTDKAVYRWRRRTARFPAAECPKAERLTGGQVLCEELRPDAEWAYIRGTSKQPAAQGA
jgi:DNA-binding transcriptional regulator YdaS (Cro superfamily)